MNMDIILLLIADEMNRRLLTSFLEKRYKIWSNDSPSVLDNYFDLCIVDGVTLSRYRQPLIERVQKEHPLFLPLLLLTHRQGVTRITANLWELVDDLLMIPIEKRELSARVETLLRSRRLSLELQRTQEQLCASQQQVQQLGDELERLNQLFSED